MKYKEEDARSACGIDCWTGRERGRTDFAYHLSAEICTFILSSSTIPLQVNHTPFNISFVGFPFFPWYDTHQTPDIAHKNIPYSSSQSETKCYTRPWYGSSIEMRRPHPSNHYVQRVDHSIRTNYLFPAVTLPKVTHALDA